VTLTNSVRSRPVRLTTPPAPNADAAYRDRLEAAKHASLGHLLFKSARLFDEQALARVRAQSGFPRLRPAHTKLLPHLDLAGTRLTDLAARLGVSKQAASQVVGELTVMGVLERAPHPDDGRARMVRFSARGRQALLHGLGVLREIEGEVAAAVGAREVATLRRLLARLLAALEKRQAPAP
jgi:DNA-binding MarR family transcriptional regulator